MKKTFSLLVLLFAAIFAQSAPVSIEKAHRVASKFLNANAKSNVSRNAEVVYTFTATDGTACIYVFNTDKGFVLVSADDHAYPILGYSEEGQFDIDQIPDGLNFQLNSFVEQIEWAISEDYITDDVVAQWQQVECDGNLLAHRNERTVDALIRDTWNQNCYYNDLCPYDKNGPCERVYVGCTSLAVGQILRYWEYPEHGQGTVSYTPSGYPFQSVNLSEATYDYANMPDNLTGGSPEIQRTATATLLWHIGVALHASYGPNGTSAIPENVPNVLKNNFLYTNGLYGQWKDDNDSWIVQCKASLDQGCPIHYSGWSESGSGHSFVCDGYNSNDQFHFNWGWSGSGNGYYAIGALNPSSHEYNSSNYAIFNIRPRTDVYCDINLTANPNNGGTVSGGGTYQEGQTCTISATANSGYTFLNWTENGNFVSTLANYTFAVTGDRNLVANFTPSTYTIATSSNPSIGGSTSGGGNFTHGQSCTVHATANADYTFVNWTENGTQVSTNADYTFNVTGSRNLVANFSQSNFTITTSANPNNGGTTTGGGSYMLDQSCTVQATANPGYTFANWTENGTQVSTDASYTFNVTGNRNLIANFEAEAYEVTVDCDAEMGTVSGGGSFIYGQTCGVFAQAKDNYIFENWTEDGIVVATDNLFSFEVTGNRNLTANFLPTIVEISATTNPENSGTITGTGIYSLGESVTLSVLPNAYYTFENWTENGEIVSTEPEYTFVVNGERDLVANLYYFDGIVNHEENDFIVYPNPAHDFVIIEGNGIKEVKIYNLYGQLLLSENISDNSEIRLNISNIHAPVCFVVLHTENGTITKRIIKE